MRLQDAPSLPDWIFLAEAAKLLRCTRQNVRLMVEGDKFRDVLKTGQRGNIMVRESEVKEMLAARGEVPEPANV